MCHKLVQFMAFSAQKNRGTMDFKLRPKEAQARPLSHIEFGRCLMLAAMVRFKQTACKTCDADAYVRAQGELFKSIARRTENILPEALPLEERRDKEKVARKVPGRRPKRGGHGGGRGCVRLVRHRVAGEATIDVVIPTNLGDDEYDPGDAVFGDNQPDLEEKIDGQNISASQLAAEPPHCNQGDLLHHHVQKPADYFPSFNLGLPPDGSLLPTHDDVQEVQELAQPDVVQHVQQSTNYCPSFNLGLTPGDSLLPMQEVIEELVQHKHVEESVQQAVNANILGATLGNDGISSQSTISLDITEEQPSIVVNPTLVAVRFGQTYELRRSKRVKKPKCGFEIQRASISIKEHQAPFRVVAEDVRGKASCYRHEWLAGIALDWVAQINIFTLIIFFDISFHNQAINFSCETLPNTAEFHNASLGNASLPEIHHVKDVDMLMNGNLGNVNDDQFSNSSLSISKTSLTVIYGQIDPLVETSDNKLVAVDAKLNFDDNAYFRQKEIYALRDPSQEDPLCIDCHETENAFISSGKVAFAKAILNYIGVDGQIGCMEGMLPKTRQLSAEEYMETYKDDLDKRREENQKLEKDRRKEAMDKLRKDMEKSGGETVVLSTGLKDMYISSGRDTTMIVDEEEREEKKRRTDTKGLMRMRMLQMTMMRTKTTKWPVSLCRLERNQVTFLLSI
ncbi:hypothetical protein AgCh_038088 [Apium graveolens]